MDTLPNEQEARKETQVLLTTARKSFDCMVSARERLEATHIAMELELAQWRKGVSETSVDENVQLNSVEGSMVEGGTEVGMMFIEGQ